MLEPITIRPRRVMLERDYLAEALVLVTTEETSLKATREHLWALQEYYESTLQAMRDGIDARDAMIHDFYWPVKR